MENGAATHDSYAWHLRPGCLRLCPDLEGNSGFLQHPLDPQKERKKENEKQEMKHLRGWQKQTNKQKP